MPEVPQQYLSVWKRTLLTTGTGHRDISTTVFWLQTKTLFADLRIPTPAPAAACPGVEHCTQQQLQELAAQQGFAGTTQVVGDICTWNREIDYQPKSGPPDVGKMAFVTPDFLTEDDPSGANAYHEDWQRVEGSSADVWSYRLESDSTSGKQGFLLGSGNYFFFAVGREKELAPEGDLLSQLEKTSPEQQHSLFEMELSFGEVVRDSATTWTILHSTLPGRAGQALLNDLTILQLHTVAQSGSSLKIGAAAASGPWKLVAA